MGRFCSDAYPANIGMPKGGARSCGNMFKMGNKWMLLCTSHSLGCRYYLATSRTRSICPYFQAMMHWNGNDWKTTCFFAPGIGAGQGRCRAMWVVAV